MSLKEAFRKMFLPTHEEQLANTKKKIELLKVKKEELELTKDMTIIRAEIVKAKPKTPAMGGLQFGNPDLWLGRPAAKKQEATK